MIYWGCMNISREELVKLLKEAEKAHGEYEKSLGRRDDNWPEWYANWIIEKLGEEGV